MCTHNMLSWRNKKNYLFFFFFFFFWGGGGGGGGGRGVPYLQLCHFNDISHFPCLRNIVTFN